MSDTPLLDVGHGLQAGLRLSEGFPDLEDGVPVGVLLSHPCAARGGGVVEDFIPIDYPGNVLPERHWRLTAREPISIEPSVHYTCCGVHGFLREGKWVPA